MQRGVVQPRALVGVLWPRPAPNLLRRLTSVSSASRTHLDVWSPPPNTAKRYMPAVCVVFVDSI